MTNTQVQQYLSLNNCTFLTFLSYFFNHILVFFVGLFEFSLTFLAKVYRVTVNHFRIKRGHFYRPFITTVEYFIIMNFLTEMHFLILVFSPLSTDNFFTT